MRRLVLGVIGHIDHGKTALVRALTGMETDRLPEEKRRGISIALGFAHFRAGPDTEIDLIDMPGHERFVRTMIGGATGIDAVLLVVAANEGIKPQTVEHVDVAALLGIGRAVIAVSKADLATEHEAARTGRAASRLLATAGVQAGAPVITAAALGDGIEALRAALLALAAEQDAAPADGVVFLPIDRAFSVAGHGTVVTGTLRGAAVAPGDELELLPAGGRVRVRGVQVHGSRVTRALPGQRVAVNLRDVETGQIPRGAALAAPGMLPASAWLSVQLRAVGDAVPLRTSTKLRLLLGTTDLDARVRLLDRDALGPGEVALAQLHCAAPVSIPARERFILRLPSPARTVAGGMILEAEAGRYRRHAPEVLRRLSMLAALPPIEVLREEVALAGAEGRALRALSRLTALAPAKVAELLQGLPVVVGRGQVAITRQAMDSVLERIPAALAEGEGLTRERLAVVLQTTRGSSHLAHKPSPAGGRGLGEGGSTRTNLRHSGTSHPHPTPLPPAGEGGNGAREPNAIALGLAGGDEVGGGVLEEALKRLVAGGVVRLNGNLYSVARPEQDKPRAAQEARLAADIVHALRQGGLSPPDAAALAPDLQARRALERLIRAGEVVRTHDRAQRRDVLFHRDAIAEARRRLTPLLEAAPGLTVGEIGAALGISRKYGVPLLEHLDVIHFTRRVGDRRTLALAHAPG